MQGLDSTITNVALPFIEGGLSATAEQVTWVLTSYVIATAIMTAPVGWLAARFGRRQVFIACLASFTLASMLCGAAQSLPQMVLSRLLQGAFGAALVPLSQATMLDIYPIERRAQAMAIWGIGVMVGPILGPTLGGWLTAFCGWRWVFYVNLPFGLLAITGLMLFMPRGEHDNARPFDWTGFLVLALGIGALQLMLDRGQSQDWFAAQEIIAEAVLAGLGFYLFVVHMLTAERPFLPPGIFRNRNFSAALAITALTGLVQLATTVLLATYLQKLAGFPVAQAGLAMAPRGAGTMVGMLFAGWLGNRLGQRRLLAAGVLMLSWALYDMSLWTPDISQHRLTATIVMQGFATGMTSNALSVLAYATLVPWWRGDAAGLISLFRNTAGAIGVSVTAALLTQLTQVVHAGLAASVTPFNHVLQGLHSATPAGAMLLDEAINRQAVSIAYSDDFRLLMAVALLPLLVLPLLRSGRRPVPIHMADAVEIHAMIRRRARRRASTPEQVEGDTVGEARRVGAGLQDASVLQTLRVPQHVAAELRPGRAAAMPVIRTARDHLAKFLRLHLARRIELRSFDRQRIVAIDGERSFHLGARQRHRLRAVVAQQLATDRKGAAGVFAQLAGAVGGQFIELSFAALDCVIGVRVAIGEGLDFALVDGHAEHVGRELHPFDRIRRHTILLKVNFVQQLHRAAEVGHADPLAAQILQRLDAGGARGDQNEAAAMRAGRQLDIETRFERFHEAQDEVGRGTGLADRQNFQQRGGVGACRQGLHLQAIFIEDALSPGKSDHDQAQRRRIPQHGDFVT